MSFGFGVLDLDSRDFFSEIIGEIIGEIGKKVLSFRISTKEFKSVENVTHNKELNGRTFLLDFFVGDQSLCLKLKNKRNDLLNHIFGLV